MKWHRLLGLPIHILLFSAAGWAFATAGTIVVFMMLGAAISGHTLEFADRALDRELLDLVGKWGARFGAVVGVLVNFTWVADH